MPRKRTDRAQRESPEARALRAAVLAELREPLIAETPKAAAKQERKAKRWADRVAERLGGLEAAIAELKRDGLLDPPTYAPVRPGAIATSPAPAPPSRRGSSAAAPASGPSPTPQRRAKRRPAGHAGYALVVDSDDYDDWE